MTDTKPMRPINEPRRKDRTIDDDAWIRDFLRRAPMGVMATVDGDQPFITNNLFVYDEAENALYLHTANEGRFRTNIEANPRVCLTAMEMGRLLPAKRAMNFSVEYASVVVFGRASVIEDGDSAKRALQILMDKYAPHLKPGTDYEPATDADLKVTAVFRIDIEQWSAKRKQAADDLPGTYRFGESPE
jgi:nitroimidazol reductase NimA-like FMN-containing flavoprotein (pyridoxamine 5'-phosphate oxidase superfamily)